VLGTATGTGWVGHELTRISKDFPPSTAKLRMCGAIPPSPSTHQRHRPDALHRPTAQTYLLTQTHCTDLSPYTHPLYRPVSLHRPTVQTYLRTHPLHRPVSLHRPTAQTCLLTQTHCTDLSPYTDPLPRPVSLHRTNCTDLPPVSLHRTNCTDLSPYTDPLPRPVSLHRPTAQTCLLTQTCLLPHAQRTDPSPNIHIVQWYFH